MQRPITKTYTWRGYGYNYLWVIFAGMFAGWFAVRGNILPRDIAIIALVLLGPTVVWAAFYFTVRFMLREHKEHLASAARRLGYEVVSSESSPDIDKPFKTMSLSALEGSENDTVHSIVRGHDWQYGEYTYEIHRTAKGGSYHAATVYYGVMTTELPRELPNVFFDSKSKSARGRQFKFHFAKSQRHSLEGDFDKYFVTYFPEQYTIDSMSFISPDVMLALRSAADYDIEIVGNRVFLYGSLMDPRLQLPDMSAKLAVIKKELLDNILTYRDQRLPYAQGRQRVAPIAANLQRSKFWKRVSIAIVVGYVLLEILRIVFSQIER